MDITVQKGQTYNVPWQYVLRQVGTCNTYIHTTITDQIMKQKITNQKFFVSTYSNINM